ncbi:putative mitochondrial A/G-specific adenine glycosylase [Leptomonas pyrrhocoris]|uniref:Adenine DNA glycosylase n=1 Tax=Leptomonas pyrrhocoris TaxID=157538 RepID=A0A0N0DZF0_LEPPY|nr:putative mitochondrial A/G-specific adenine glycosylase [Leptomonas pyrrhocoris]KPA85211.1 putative mitochondrial A/G-specific adenine glycosylase [Leptomonas pyrrhocoris]|eukprot:XP_015663650.1 putative mitochondrial A/G-specific adenine glycosylase [Leptomonas pyrrhocoris]
MSRRPTVKRIDPHEWRTPTRVGATCAFYRAIQEDVIAWWRRNQRTDLPWRPATGAETSSLSSSKSVAGSSSSVAARTPLYNPYEVWVSEVMSQQTRMETVIPYFNKWMDKFPTIEALAAASEDEVRAVWAGMGYYRRALYLHKGSQYLLEWRRRQPSDKCSRTSAASMPSTQQELLKVPGIGPYTSAAVASLCFGEAVCSVDGNVIRVLSRLRGERGFDPKVPANVKRACGWGQELMGNTPQTASVVCGDPSALNQGLMELGSSVCRPGGAPLCSSCPLRAHCCAYALLQSGEIDAIEGFIPIRAAAAAKRCAKEISVVHEVVEDAAAASEASQRRFVVVRRPPTGLLAGMLEFPTVSAAAEDGGAKAGPALQEHPLCALPLLRSSKEAPLNVKTCGSIRHIFSHIDMDVEVFHVQWPAQINVPELLRAVASVVDERHADSECNPFPAATRIFFMSEAELKAGAPSRLMLKVLHQVSSHEVKRKRSAAPQEASVLFSPSPTTASKKRACR